MSQDLESLRASYQAVPGGPPRADCPQPEELWDASAGSLPPRRLARVVDHLASCPACREAWRLAQDLETTSPEERGEDSQTVRPPTGAWWSWAAAAAALAAVLFVALVLPTWRTTARQSQSIAPWRGGGSAELRSLVSETELQPRSRLLLRWTPAGVGARYQVRVTTPNLTTVAGAGALDAPQYLVPEASLANLPAGATLLWQVSASLPDGRFITSPTFVARIR